MANHGRPRTVGILLVCCFFLSSQLAARKGQAAEEYAPAMGAMAFWMLGAIGSASPLTLVAQGDDRTVSIDVGLGASYAPGAMAGTMNISGFGSPDAWLGWEGRSRFDLRVGERGTASFDLRQRLDTMALFVPYRSPDRILKLELQLGASIQPRMFDTAEGFELSFAVGPLVGTRFDIWAPLGVQAVTEANWVPAFELVSASGGSYQLQVAQHVAYFPWSEGTRDGVGFRLTLLRDIPLRRAISAERTALLLSLSITGVRKEKDSAEKQP